MYKYDAYDQAIVDERVAQFRDQTRRYLAGELTEDEFRPLRLQNGLYIQRHAPMLRVAVPYGLLSSTQMRKLAHIARTYDRGYGHFTTRQNIQYNWPKLEEVPDILAELAAVEMHAIQTSGNCVRNITTDHFAGVARRRDRRSAPARRNPAPVVDVPSRIRLPAAQVQDRGERRRRGPRRRAAARHRPARGARTPPAKCGLRVIVGGGMGRTPIIGHVMREFLPWQHMLTYIEAILRVYNRYGRRDNIYKARIKILVKALGVPTSSRGRSKPSGTPRRIRPRSLTAGGVRPRRGALRRRPPTRAARHRADVRRSRLPTTAPSRAGPSATSTRTAGRATRR